MNSAHIVGLILRGFDRVPIDAISTLSDGGTIDGPNAFRQFLLDNRNDYAAAYAGFRWPDAVPFN